MLFLLSRAPHTLCVLWSLASNGLLGGASFRLARGLRPGTCVTGAGGEVPLCSLLLPPGPPRAVCPRVYDHASPSRRQGTPRCALRADGSAFFGRAGPVEPGGDGNEKEMRLWLFPLGLPRMQPVYGAHSVQASCFSSSDFPPFFLPLSPRLTASPLRPCEEETKMGTSFAFFFFFLLLAWAGRVLSDCVAVSYTIHPVS